MTGHLSEQKASWIRYGYIQYVHIDPGSRPNGLFDGLFGLLLLCVLQEKMVTLFSWLAPICSTRLYFERKYTYL